MQVRIRDAATGAVIKKVFFKPPPWDLQGSFEVVPYFSGNCEPELAVPLRDADDGSRQVQIRDSVNGAVVGNIKLPK